MASNKIREIPGLEESDIESVSSCNLSLLSDEEFSEEESDLEQPQRKDGKPQEIKVEYSNPKPKKKDGGSMNKSRDQSFRKMGNIYNQTKTSSRSLISNKLKQSQNP